VLAGYSQRLPLEVLYERRPGKNVALNRAVASFEGDLVVITDDDVLPEPGWLLRLTEAAMRHPEASVFGGTILPRWPRALPHWLNERWVNFGVLFALLSHHSGPCDFSAIYGPNMAVRRLVFDQGYRFDEGIGPDTTNPLSAMGSETEFTRRLLAAGHRARFVAEARVSHIIRPEQLQESWVLARAWRNGLGSARTDAPALTRGRAIVAGLTWRLLLRLVVFRLTACAVAGLPPSGWRLRLLFKDRWFAGLAAGMAAAARAERGGGVADASAAPADA